MPASYPLRAAKDGTNPMAEAPMHNVINATC
jgi:hypothetical protein